MFYIVPAAVLDVPGAQDRPDLIAPDDGSAMSDGTLVCARFIRNQKGENPS